MTKQPHSEFGRRLREARIHQGHSQRELARLARISPVYANRLEHGRQMPSIAVLRRLAKVVEKTIGELVG